MGKIRIVDFDYVEVSNLHRQVVHSEAAAEERMTKVWKCVSMCTNVILMVRWRVGMIEPLLLPMHSQTVVKIRKFVFRQNLLHGACGKSIVLSQSTLYLLAWSIATSLMSCLDVTSSWIVLITFVPDISWPMLATCIEFHWYDTHSICSFLSVLRQRLSSITVLRFTMFRCLVRLWVWRAS